MSNKKNMSTSMSKSTDEALDESCHFQLEKKHVFQVYDSIAGHFSQTRHKPWPRVAEFLLSLPSGDLVYDVGCGNAKYFSVNPNLSMVGCDSSSNLLTICKERGMDSVVAEMQKLPFRSASADHLICIAVLHHLSSEERRISALVELTRVLKPGGTGLIYVWAFEQSKGGNNSNYTSKNTTSSPSDDSKKHPVQQEVNIPKVSHSTCTSEKGQSSPMDQLVVHQNRTPFKQQDVLVPWKLAGSSESFFRYYHVFKENELNYLCQKVPGLSVLDSYYDDGNWCVQIIKNVST